MVPGRGDGGSAGSAVCGERGRETQGTRGGDGARPEADLERATSDAWATGRESDT